MDMESADTEPTSLNRGNNMVVKAYPLGMVRVMNNNGISEDEGDSGVEPYVGLEFDTAEEAREFYNSFATRTGFKVRTGQLYRSRTDGTVSSRRFVCSKEGFQLNSRTGCPAFIRVQRRDTGKWVLDQIQKEHNHELGGNMEETTPRPSVQQRAPAPTKLAISVPHRPKMKVVDEADKGRSCPSGVISFKRFKGAEESEEQTQPKATEPYAGLEFGSANEACQFYQAYAEVVGFRVRIGQLFRSKVDGSITSRRFVCSKEGFQHPSRMGCGAYMRIKRQDSGGWIVDRLNKDHNHDLEPGKKNAGMKKITEDVTGGLDSVDLIELNDFSNHVNKTRENTIGKEWYPVLLDYFQSKQAEDMGFFYAVELDTNGSCMSIFWADSRSRFACSQAKERENLRSFPNEFKYEYEKCLYQTQTTVEFDTMWSALVNKYGLRDNMWLRDIYEKRENWVPAYLRASFFGGIPVNGTFEPFYGTSLDSLTSLREFVSRYEQGLEQRREEERKEDFNSYNLQPFLQTKEPVEEQCRRLYTLTIFRVFQSELAQSYNYLGLKTYEEGAISRFLDLKALMIWSLREAASKYIEFGTSSLEKYKLAYEIMREAIGSVCAIRLSLYNTAANEPRPSAPVWVFLSSPFEEDEALFMAAADSTQKVVVEVAESYPSFRKDSDILADLCLYGTECFQQLGKLYSRNKEYKQKKTTSTCKLSIPNVFGDMRLSTYVLASNPSLSLTPRIPRFLDASVSKLYSTMSPSSSRSTSSPFLVEHSGFIDLYNKLIRILLHEPASPYTFITQISSCTS
ncbi:unnamed protein product [Thlaspi arvense]|uniref:Protein FAR1-RELATED SEQUENCE n=1 Tax=Thlaspi arvense TaxID=13288 RepID=A0AAU9S2F1_THLAR|nr:unnamed protein product [Thlaspi arvense]